MAPTTSKANGVEMKFISLHPWNISLHEARLWQKRLSHKIHLTSNLRKPKIIAGIDTAFDLERRECVAGVLVFKFPELEIIEKKSCRKKIEFPYIPGFLSFREGPAILNAIEKLLIVPDIFFFDGQGIAHPRKMGIATHIGLFLDRPTIGCAKSRLCGEYDEPLNRRGHFTFLRQGKEVIGAVLRTRENTKPIFVSPGHKICLSAAIELTLTCVTKFRIPEPIRQAHKYVENRKKAVFDI
jgi:deoxyribonuclease V